MQIISSWLGKISSRHDLVLAAMLMIAVVMLILPLPTVVLDFLIAINLTIAVILITTAIYVKDPLELAAFPSILLLTTLYRLALTVSTSRLILLQHDAGHIVYAFGTFVVGGNLAVGVIVFAIVTIVQFIVITKGAERVAEVSARFSLDGMPGKQMSIDNDLRAGQIDAAESRRLRQLVQKESQLFGAMDGAMKFVKGDAIASIVVILVNLVGGIVIGVLQAGLDIGQAVSTYSLLSVGDGLVSQIPAIIISVAAGLIVTRVPGEQRENLADDLARQLSTHPLALCTAGAVLMMCGLLPGFPLVVFLVLGGAVAGIGWRFQRRRNNATGATGEAGSHDELAMKPGVEAVSVRLANGAVRIDKLAPLLEGLRWRKFSELGIPLKSIGYETSARLATGSVEFMLYGQPVCTVVMREGLCLVSAHKLGDTKVVSTETLPFGHMLSWVSPPVSEALQSLGIEAADQEQRIILVAGLVIDRFARELVGVQETHYLMSRMEDGFPELVKEMQRQLPVGKVADILQRLVAEGISIVNMRAIFEALIEWAPREKDALMLTEYVRLALRRQIVNRWRGSNPMLGVWLVGRTIENMLRESIRQTAAGAYSALGAEENERIVHAVREQVGSDPERGVLVTAIDTRRFLRKLVERDLFALPVLSMQELGDDVQTEILGNVDLVPDYGTTL